MNAFKHLADFTISPEDNNKINTTLADLENTLTLFALSFTPEETKRMVKIGLKSESFSKKALEVARLHSNLLPRNLDLAMIERDLAAREQILVHFIRVKRIYELLQSTLAALGVDFYAGGRAIYQALKANGRHAGLDDVIAELAIAFERKPKKDEDEEPKTTAPVTPNTPA